MKQKLSQISQILSGFRRDDVQLLLVILTLAMLVLGIGAPSDGGGATRIRF